MELKNRLRQQSTMSFQVIIAGFMGLIIVGALLLMLPIASKDRTVTSFSDTLFTAVSATCVTGLVVRDTATHWSMFGQAIILFLIQIGGMGVITISMAIVRLSGKKIGLWQRSTMQEAISAPQLGGIVKFTGFIIRTSAIIELVGALLLLPVFCKEFGLMGIWYAVFHSISAFCNAGFDLMGIRAQFSSLTSFYDSVYVNTVICLMIVVGGISFMTWGDIKENKLSFKKYSLQSKIILITSGVLILLPALYFFIFEYSALPIKDRILCSVFQSITTRTAGFNTTDLSAMSDTGKVVMIALMLVGGSPGSTAGGMKTTTVAVLFLGAITVFRRKNDVQCFNRRLPEDTIRSAGAIFFIYMALVITTASIICRIEGLPILTCLFETGSAIGTVGLTLGITPTLSAVSRILLMFLMFFGRLGGLTMIYAALPSCTNDTAKMPLEKITVG
ncbi:MAG: TrkH family potassium uptake protein [Oscillospiraceae bacterium]